MSGIPAETLLLCLVCGVFLGFAFAVLEFLRLLFSLGKIAAAVTDVLFCHYIMEQEKQPNARYKERGGIPWKKSRLNAIRAASF